MKRIFREGGELLFDPSYLPKSLPHRERQYSLLKEAILDGLEGGRFSTPILFGGSGTGKTSTLRKVFVELGDYSDTVRHILINATTHSKTYVAIYRITSKIIPIPERGYGLDEMILKLYDRLDIENLKYVVAIDDADELIRRGKGKIIDILTRIEENYSRRLIYPIIVLRNINIINGLSSHIASKLGGMRIEFTSYNKKQLKDILNERIEDGLAEDAISENAVDASAFATEKIFLGNARELLNIIFKAGKMAEFMRERRILTEHVRNAIYESYTKSLSVFFRRKKEKYYRILWALSKVITNNPDIYRVDEAVDEVYKIYNRNFRDKLTYSEFKELLLELSKISNNIISLDYGDLVFLSYPAKKLYENLSRKIFLNP